VHACIPDWLVRILTCGADRSAEDATLEIRERALLRGSSRVVPQYVSEELAMPLRSLSDFQAAATVSRRYLARLDRASH